MRRYCFAAFQIIRQGGSDFLHACESQANLLNIQADSWAARRCRPAAGEMRLKAFAAYRSSWQFAAPDPTFDRLYALHREAFALAIIAASSAATVRC